MDARLFAAIQRLPRPTTAGAGSAATAMPGSLEFGFGRRLAGKLAENISQSIFREVEYLVNARGPTMMPPLEELINLWNGDYFSIFGNPRRTFNTFALMYGADFTSVHRNTAGGEERRHLWNAILESKRPRYPVAFLRKLYRQGVAGAEPELRDALKQEGFPSVAQQGLYIDEYEPMGVGTIIALWRLGILDSEAEVISLLKVLGYRREEALSLMSADAVRIDPTTALTLLNLRLTGEAGVRESLRYSGFQNNADVDNMMRLRFTSPSLPEMLTYGNLTVAGQSLVRFKQMSVGMPDIYKEWASRLGYDMSSDPAKQYGTVSSEDSFARLAWDNQWMVPTIPLLSQFLHRFRGDPNDPSTWNVQGVQPLSLEEANACLTANGVADGLKPYVLNLMYAPLPMRHLWRVAGSGMVGVPWIAGKLMDNGMSPADANLVAPLVLQQAADKANAPVRALQKRTIAKLVSTIERSYSVGTLARPIAQSELVANGVPAGIADTMLATVDLEVANRTIEQVVRRAKSDVFAGRTTMAAAQGRLVQAGMAHERVAQIIAGWSAEFGEGRKHVATSQILRYLRKGFLTRDQALLRLSNIGWAGADMLLLLSDVQQQVASDTARSLAAAEREKVHEERAIQTQLDRTVTLWDRLISRMKVLTPPAKVVKWYKDGLWSETRTRERLRLLGYTDDVIDTMLLEALHVAPKKPAKPKGTVP